MNVDKEVIMRMTVVIDDGGCLVPLDALTEAVAEATAESAVEEIGPVPIPGHHFQDRDPCQEGDHPAIAEVRLQTSENREPSFHKK